MIELNIAAKRYDSLTTVIDKVSFTVKAGEYHNERPHGRLQPTKPDADVGPGGPGKCIVMDITYQQTYSQSPLRITRTPRRL